MSGARRALGPALIVGSLVLGPGSILAASRVGCDTGYELAWVVVLGALLMLGATALAARVGALLPGTPCEELARAAGRPVAALVGVVSFLIVTCFQFGNNVGVLAALRPLFGAASAAPMLMVVGINAAAAGALMGLRRLYRPIERSMKVLVGLMVLGFVGNLLFARPALGNLLRGLVPSVPGELVGHLLPRVGAGPAADPLLPVMALVGTTFSVAAAFYQAYLVREKGWGERDLGRALVDSAVGIGVLGALTLVVLATAAAVLHGRVQGSELGDASDVARLLEPLFGRAALVLFCTGLFAGAASSFLVNVMVGGPLLAEGLGLGGRIDERGPRVCTLIALAVGMAVALLVTRGGVSPVRLVVAAQSLTVLGNPLLALVLLWLGLRVPRRSASLLVLGSAGFVVVLVLAARTAVRLWG